jgi:hypothetical protein
MNRLIAKQKANCRAQLDFYVQQSKKTLQRFGDHVPMFFLEKKPDGIAFVVPDFRSDSAKDASVQRIRQMLIEFASDFFVHVSEVWLIQRKPEDAIERPSLAADRHSALMLTFNQRDGKMVEITIPFEKGGCGKIFFSQPVEHYSGFGKGDDFEECGGRFADLRRW